MLKEEEKRREEENYLRNPLAIKHTVKEKNRAICVIFE